MSRWLTVAEGIFRGRVSEPPPPFAIVCQCGTTVSGLRTKAAQIQSCHECRARLFVIPACVYPQPRLTKRKVVVVPQSKATVAKPESDDSSVVEPGSSAADSGPASLAEPARTVREPAEPKTRE